MGQVCQVSPTIPVWNGAKSETGNITLYGNLKPGSRTPVTKTFVYLVHRFFSRARTESQHAQDPECGKLAALIDAMVGRVRNAAGNCGRSLR